jgi:protein-tyrosine phosphatase
MRTQNKVQIILNELYPNENVDVPDPYFGMTNGFEIVYTMLDEVCDIIADKLIAIKFASTVISLSNEDSLIL